MLHTGTKLGKQVVVPTLGEAVAVVAVSVFENVFKGIKLLGCVVSRLRQAVCHAILHIVVVDGVGCGNAVCRVCRYGLG